MSRPSLKFKLLILFAAFSVVVFVVLGFVAYIYVGNSNAEKSQNESQHYQILDVNPLKRTISSGIVSIPGTVPPQGKYQYFEESGKHMLISKLGDTEYQCRGTCSCSNNDQRRVVGVVSPSLIQKSVFFLVASISSVFAVHYALQHFEKQCSENLKDSCPMNDIRWDVDKCSKMSETGREESDPKVVKVDATDTSSSSEWTDDDCNVVFYCKGSCQWNNKKYGKNAYDKEIDKKCNGYSLDKDVTVLSSKTKTDIIMTENKRARKKFAHTHLTPFCKSLEPFCFGKIIGCRQVGVSTVSEEMRKEANKHGGCGGCEGEHGSDGCKGCDGMKEGLEIIG